MGINLNTLPTTFQTAFTNAKTQALSILDTLKAQITTWLNVLQSTITNSLNSIPSIFMRTFDQAKQNVINSLNALPGIIQGILNNIAKTISSWVAPALNLGGLALPGHAEGIINSPVGHLAVVGEKGPELAFVPKGGSILSHGFFSSGAINGGLVSALRDLTGLAGFSRGNSLPSGVSAIPPSMHVSPTIIVNLPPSTIELDGYRLTNSIMPYMVDAIRGAAGVRQ